MKYLKQLLVALKKLGFKINPGVIALILLAVGLLVLYLRYRAKKKAAAAEGGGAPAPAPVPKAPPPMPRNRFSRVWDRFLKQLPAVVRRSIHQFQPMVVLGGMASGKTALIGRHTDWRRQSRYLFGSQLDHPDLQLYLGSRVVVLEVPAPVLTGTSSGLREALLSLFRRLFRRRTPVAVVAINPAELDEMSTDEVRAHADSIRGKINLLSQARRSPVEVRVAVTHLDRQRGFEDLAQVVHQGDGVLELPIRSDRAATGLIEEIETQLHHLARVRASALVELSAERYLGVVSFLREAPTLLGPVARFGAALMAAEPLSQPPLLSSVHLTSAELPNPASNPFHAPKVSGDRLRDPLLHHRVAASAVAGLITFVLIAEFVREHSAWRPAKAALERYVGEKRLRQRPEFESALRGEVVGFIDRTSLLPFFSGAEAKAARSVARHLHQDFILHELDDALTEPDGLRRSIYLAALADLETGDALASMLKSKEVRERWARATGLEASMIADYLRVVGALGSERPRAPSISPPRRRPSDDEVLALDKFALYFRQAVEAGDTSQAALGDLRRQASQLGRGIEAIEARPDVPELLRGRAEAEPERADLVRELEPYLPELRNPAVLGRADRRAELLALLELVERSAIKPPPDVRRYLDLCDWVQRSLSSDPVRLLTDGRRVDPREVDVSIDDHRLQGADWLALTRDQTIEAQLEAFLSQPRRQVFFIPGRDHPPIVMNPKTRGEFLFRGRSQISGRFTREALLRDVVPTLACHDRVMRKLPAIAPATATRLDELIRQERESYAESYLRSMTEFYSAFGIDTAQAADNLHVVLDRLLRGSSPLTRHLTAVSENADFGTVDGDARALLGPLRERLVPFLALGEVVTSTASGDPPYLSYLLILRQVREALQPADPSLGGGDAPAEGDAQTLRDRLDPAGEMALDISTCAPESKLQAVEQWMDDVNLPRELRAPFRAPILELYRVGQVEIARVMEDVWRYDFLEVLDPLLMKFPFSLTSANDASPEEVTALLHPLTGQLIRTKKRLVEPLELRPPECHARVGRLRPPSGLRHLSRGIDRLASRLWDETGQPMSLTLSVAPVPFESVIGGQPDKQLTLTFVGSGGTTLVNFNQRPFAHDLEEPWTTVHTAQVGVKLTNLSTRDVIYPEPLVESSYWALHRLLVRAKRSGSRFDWKIRFRTRGADGQSTRLVLPVKFDIKDDPFQAFRLRSYSDGTSSAGRLGGLP
ncbi:MAG: type VI secretion protein IcmF/TssM N-terminal domain-containing protein [Myxococcota bacterium]